MSFKNQNPQSLFRDILDAIHAIGVIIAEAGVRLGEDAPALCPDQPWPNIRGLGNWLRHGYDRVDLNLIWHTVTDDLPSLEASIQKALSATPSG